MRILSRCNYSAHIPDTIEEPLKPVKHPETVHTPNSRTSKKYEDLKTPEDVADYFDLTLTKKGNTYIFEDEVYGCSITIPGAYSNRKSKRYNEIDIKNNGEGYYDLKEVIKIYSNAHPILKHATNGITFNSREGKKDVLAFAQKYTKEGDMKQITVNPYALRYDKNRRGNLRQTLYHEMGHCLDFSMSIDERYGISNTDEFRKAQQKDAVRQETIGYPKEKSSWYGASKDSEDWAEMCSMAAFDGLSKEERRYALMTDYSRNTVVYDDWVEEHKYAYEFAVEKLNTIKPSDFVFY